MPAKRSLYEDLRIPRILHVVEGTRTLCGARAGRRAHDIAKCVICHSCRRVAGVRGRRAEPRSGGPPQPSELLTSARLVRGGLPGSKR